MIQKFIEKFSDKEKNLFYLTIVVLLVLLVDRIFLGPILSSIKELDENIKYQENSIKRDLRFLSYKDHIISERKILKKYYNRKPQTEEEIIAGFLKRIEVLASSAKVNVIKLTPPGEAEQKKGYKEYVADLECSGKIKDVISFMHAVDSSDELLRIIRLSMNAKKASSEDILSSMAISKMIIDLPVIPGEETNPIETNPPSEALAAPKEIKSKESMKIPSNETAPEGDSPSAVVIQPAEQKQAQP